jgi:hypothetical protein
MTVTLHSTTKIVNLDNHRSGQTIECRIWEGATESGIACHAYIPRIAVHQYLDASQFETELKEQRPPTAAVLAIPLRLVL